MIPFLITGKNENDTFRQIICDIDMNGSVMNKGSAFETIELTNVVIHIKEFENDGIITTIYPADEEYIKKEIELYYSKSISLSDFAQISNFWKNVSDDGLTIRSSYGYILFEKHGFDQLQYCIDVLKQDITTRKAVLTYKTPYQPKTKDNICTLSQQFLFRNGKLSTIVTMRSNDVIYGFRNDLPWFRELQKKVAKELGVEVGDFTHQVGSLHIYKRHYNVFNKTVGTRDI